VSQFVKLTFITVGVYIIVSNATGAGKLLGTAGTAYSNGVKTLQGR
jgi:hypothetical protein